MASALSAQKICGSIRQTSPPWTHASCAPSACWTSRKVAAAHARGLSGWLSSPPSTSSLVSARGEEGIEAVRDLTGGHGTAPPLCLGNESGHEGQSIGGVLDGGIGDVLDPDVTGFVQRVAR